MARGNAELSFEVGIGSWSVSSLPRRPSILGGSLDDVLATGWWCVDMGRINALVGDLGRILRAVAQRTKHSKSEDDCQNFELVICTWTRIPLEFAGQPLLRL